MTFTPGVVAGGPEKDLHIAQISYTIIIDDHALPWYITKETRNMSHSLTFARYDVVVGFMIMLGPWFLCHKTKIRHWSKHKNR